jgi:hypothetical protein
LSLLLISSGSVARAQRVAPPGDDAVVVAITSLEQQWLDHEHDRATLERIVADDFVHPVASGVFLTRAQHIDWAVAHPAPAGERRRFEDLRVRVYGDAAIATGIVVATGADGAIARTIFTDAFARRQGRWQAVNAQENAIAKSRGVDPMTHGIVHAAGRHDRVGRDVSCTRRRRLSSSDHVHRSRPGRLPLRSDRAGA